MQWNYLSYNNLGDSRIIEKFAFFPICINGVCKWLQFVTIQQRVERDGDGYKWENIKFIDYH